MSLKLLKIVNSAASGGRGVGSILHAIQLFGRNGLQRWLAVLSVGSSARSSAVERERTLVALERARFCETIALGTGLRGHASALFLMGMLSCTLSLAGATTDDMVAQLRVSGDVSSALLGRDGLYTPVVALASAYMVADWVTAVEIGGRLRVLEQLPGWYAGAATWAREARDRM